MADLFDDRHADPLAYVAGYAHVPGIWSQEQIAAWKKIVDDGELLARSPAPTFTHTLFSARGNP